MYTLSEPLGRERAYEIAEIIIQSGIQNIDARDGFGNTPPHLAVCFEFKAPDWPLVDLFLKHGACLDSGDRHRRTCLHHVCQTSAQANNLDAVNQLLQRGSHANAVDYQGSTPLMLTKDLKIAHRLVTGDTPADVNKQNKQKRTALHIAVSRNMLPIVEMLLEHGAQVNTMDVNYNTPLISAVTSKHGKNNACDQVAILWLLIKHTVGLYGSLDQTISEDATWALRLNNFKRLRLEADLPVLVVRYRGTSVFSLTAKDHLWYEPKHGQAFEAKKPKTKKFCKVCAKSGACADHRIG